MTNHDPEEHMTGWDSPEDVEQAITFKPQGLGAYLLLALSEYLRLSLSDDLNSPERLYARNAVTDALNKIDWNAIEFALHALEQGEDIYSSRPGEDTVIKYTPRQKHDPNQLQF